MRMNLDVQIYVNRSLIFEHLSEGSLNNKSHNLIPRDADQIVTRCPYFNMGYHCIASVVRCHDIITMTF